MKVNRSKIISNIETIISEGIINGEEADVTTGKIMDEIELLIRAVEKINRENKRGTE